MEKAYKLAREGGYEGRVYAPKLGAELLDPSFWKSLGLNERTVTLDLPEMHSTVMGRPRHREKQKAVYTKKTPNRWKTEWHRFINHLAEGGNVDEFFNKLLK